MPLPSQSARSAAVGRSSMYRRKRKGFGPLLVGGLVIVAAAVAVWAILPSPVSGPKTAGAAPPPVKPEVKPDPKPDAPSTLAKKPEPKPEVKATPPAPLVEIGQGSAGSVKHAPDSPKMVPLSDAPKQDSQRPATPVSAPPAAQAPAPKVSEPHNPVPSNLPPSLAAAKQKEDSGDLVAARVLYSRALVDGTLMPSQQAQVRELLTRINDELVFSPTVRKDDPFVDTYAIQSGDSLIKVNQKLNLSPDWRLIQRINRMADPGRLRLGQRLKVVKGPFHAVVHKSEYRLDLFMGAPDKPSDWVYVRSYTVGLGEGNSTPIGNFIVRKGSKLVDPPWVNPRTGEKFEAGPTCPIGKYWIGLEGVGDSASAVGYGIHGTIDPDSIGKQKSMGCVRLGNEDIAMLYEMLVETTSQIKIDP